MRKVLTLVVAILVAMALVSAATAATSDTTWRVSLVADNGAGGGFGTAMQIGVATNATDGADLGFSPPLDSPSGISADIGGTSRWATGVIAGQNNVYERMINSPASPFTYPKNQKIWNLRVGALPAADAQPIRLQLKSLTTNPNPTIGGRPVFFEMMMVNNKGIAGAPANNTKWLIPIPTGASGSVFWSITTAADTNGVVWGNLPILKLSSKSDAAMLADGYQMQFRMVPEPSSMLALASGLTGLVGFVIRRRKA